MKKPSYPTRLFIIALILCVPTIGASHFGSIYLGRENGILLGFFFFFPCVTYACWKLFIDNWREEDDE